MKTTQPLLILLGLFLSFQACKKTEPTPEPPKNSNLYELQGEYSFNSGAHEAVDMVRLPNNDGYLILGSSRDGGKTYYYLIKTDDYGTKQWGRLYGSVGFNNEPRKVLALKDGNYLIGGNVYMSKTKPYLVKLNSDGDVIWEQAMLNDSLNMNESDYLYDMILHESGKVVFAGKTSNVDQTKPNYATYAQFDIFDHRVTEIDIDGNVNWSKIYGFVDQDESQQIHETSDGNYLVYGNGQFRYNQPEIVQQAFFGMELQSTSGNLFNTHNTTIPFSDLNLITSCHDEGRRISTLIGERVSNGRLMIYQVDESLAPLNGSTDPELFEFSDSTGTISISQIIALKNGNFFITATLQDGNGNLDMHFAELASDFTLIWEEFFDTALTQEEAITVVPVESANALVGFAFSGTTQDGQKIGFGYRNLE